MKKILLVEDDAFFVKFYQTKLLEAGYDVTTAQNGLLALEALKTFKPNLIILDIIMPEMDGFDFLEHKNQQSTISKIPVLMFSTLGQKEDEEKALALGANDFINKSYFDFDNLKSKIEKLT